MPRRRSVWSSWNHVDGAPGDETASVTYWMNRLQALDTDQPLLVTLNPRAPLRDEVVLHSETYYHPLFDRAAIEAQQRLWTLQGQARHLVLRRLFRLGFS